MTHVITGICLDVMDQSCISVCPVDCIYFEDTDRMCYIHPDECIDCGVCVEACPVAAIFVDKDTPTEWQAYLDINALWFKDKDDARAKADALSKPAK